MTLIGPVRVPLTIISGDGIGPEITAALVEVFDALGNPFALESAVMGLTAYREYGDPLPLATQESFGRTRLAIKGPVQTPLGNGYASPLVRLRNQFELFANIRPVQTLIQDNGRPLIDMVIFRENTEGLYSATENYCPVGDDPRGKAVATASNSRSSCVRILRHAFDHAIKYKRRKVTVVHKANVLKILSGIFLEAARELYQTSYDGQFELEEMIVDACAMKMVMAPSRFDVIVTTNMFGDILSDLAAGLIGGLGLAPGANVGVEAALFEAVHGSAPDIAGKGIANPIALMLSGAMLLDYVNKPQLASRLRSAIDQTLHQDRVRTPDIGGSATCDSLTSAIVKRIIQSS